MKKIIAAIIISLGLVSSANAGSTGVGLSADMGVGFAAQIEDKLNLSLGNSGFAADYIIKKTHIDADFNTDVINDISWYVSTGVGYYWADWIAKSGDIDIRVPVGVVVKFAEKFDSYVQAAPALRILGEDGKLGFAVVGAIGVRYYF